MNKIIESMSRTRRLQLTTMMHEIIQHVQIAKLRAGIESGRPIILGFSTEHITGDLAEALDAYRQEIGRIANAAEMRWKDEAWRTGVYVMGEELLISIEPVQSKPHIQPE
jgi:hypothetical protein